MSRALTKTKPDPEADGRQQDLERFTAFRMENDLPFDRKHLPAWWENLPDLENRYWRSEQKAGAVKAALPPARPRRPFVRKALVRKGDAPGNLIIRKTGDFGREEVECLLSYVDESIKALAKEVGELRRKDIEEIQKALDKRLLWRGTWRAGETYAANDLTQDKGTIWVCTAAKSEARPGSGSGWRLLVKTAGKGDAR